MRRAGLILLLLGLLVSTASADYLEVRRSATLKAAPEGDAEVRARPEIDDLLPLLDESQTNGYYFARNESGTEGWIYRTLVRRHAGATPAATEVVTPATNLVTASATAAIPVYDRSDWDHWEDFDGDCVNVRHEVLIEESLVPVTMMEHDPCKVESGQWDCAFTGMTFTDSDDIQIDHMVPLKNAHLSGAWQWDGERREFYANDRTDPLHLIAVQGSANMSKGSRGPEAWKPPNEDYWCEYAENWLAIKARWDLTLTAAEAMALYEMLATCGE